MSASQPKSPSLHPSGLFSYDYCVPGIEDPIHSTEYHDIELLRDVGMAESGAKEGLTFHQPSKCRKGTRLVVISQVGWHLMGYDDMNEIVLDVLLKSE